MALKVTLEQTVDVMEEILENGGAVNFNPRGISMMPMLHMDGDRVIIKKPQGYLKKYDLPLFRRDDGKFVLHRVVKKPSEEGIYSICGDNQRRVEKNVRHDQIIGVVTGFYRKGKFISCDSFLYKLYCRIWVNTRPIGFIINKVLFKLNIYKV